MKFLKMSFGVLRNTIKQICELNNTECNWIVLYVWFIL